MRGCQTVLQVDAHRAVDNAFAALRALARDDLFMLGVIAALDRCDLSPRKKHQELYLWAKVAHLTPAPLQLRCSSCAGVATDAEMYAVCTMDECTAPVCFGRVRQETACTPT